MTQIIAVSQPHYYSGLAKRLSRLSGHRFHLLTRKEDLNPRHLARLKPQFIFFPHWSFMIPPEVFQHYECVIFHMTDVPYGRGGSPLQNLISRGIYRTRYRHYVVKPALMRAPSI